MSSLGVQTWTDSAIQGLDAAPPTDMDLVIGQRLRWTLAGERGGPSGVSALMDARFTVDPGPVGTPPFEWSNVRQLGAQVRTGKVLVDLGRHPVLNGGPRLFDGVQVIGAVSDTVRLGGWVGLAPDIFTTLPAFRPGFGPVIAVANSRFQFSAVGDVLLYEGAVDRVGMLTQGRWTIERTIDLMGRVDAELVGPEDTRLVDGQLVFVASPNRDLRFDALYNAFSSYRYLGSELDPDLDRFSQRLAQLGINLDLVQDVRDPTLNHLGGGGVRWQDADADGPTPKFGLMGRYRYHPDELNRYARVNPQAGVANIANLLDLTADANLIQVDDGTQYDAGLLVYLEPRDSSVAFDASARLVLADGDLGKPGFYTDLFINIVSPELDMVFIAGGSIVSEPDVLLEQQDLGFGAFVRMAKYLRPPR